MPVPNTSDPPVTETNMLVYRIIKRLPNRMVVFDRIRRPIWSPWKKLLSRHVVTETAFKIITERCKIEGSYDEEIKASDSSVV